ncbi:unnamed protein product [Cladocopium goreaui]|uniref:Uncharacterized protein n=1 Tax=Cladocopium goreaui TaxID=2562237 RepID=A0A9P1DLQ1_9DINO|nr:unnamed protein product [Cladocopium goreaui]
MARSSNPSNSESPSSSRSPSGEEREETEFLADESPVEEEDDVPENGPPEEEILDECLHKYQEVFEDTFEEMRLTTDVVEEVRQAFNQFIALQSSRDAAGMV